MVLPDGAAVLGFDTFTGHAGADHFRQTVIVDGVDIEGLLNLLAHGIGPRFGAAHRDLQRAFAGIDASRVKLIEDGEEIARRDENHVRLEVADELHLPLGHTTRHRHDGQPQPLGAVVESKTAGEKPVAV
jgi:hypothetical protein